MAAQNPTPKYNLMGSKSYDIIQFDAGQNPTTIIQFDVGQNPTL